jgi:pseudouridine-5'-phosphate glycosidase
VTSLRPVAVSDEVADAVASGRPVVALESTIIAHGLPRPRNLEVAAALEGTVRAGGAVPATVGVVGGRPVVGLSGAEVERLASGADVAKASVRDLPLVMASGADAATTVASTALLARAAGIDVFATGGLGGVHRGAGATFDESADLPSLARTPVVVVCAGVKSILDVGATLERIETLGITVVGWRTRHWPGFYVADSGHVVDAAVEGPEEVAAALAAAAGLGLGGAIVVGVPVPLDRQLDPAIHEAAIAEGLTAAGAAGVRGKAVTPFLLDHLQRSTGGASLEANVAAVTGSATVGAAIAVAVASGRVPGPPAGG